MSAKLFVIEVQKGGCSNTDEPTGYVVLSPATRGGFHYTEERARAFACSEATAKATIKSIDRPGYRFRLSPCGSST